MTKLLQGGRMVRRKAHNLEIGGSSPLPALTFPQGGACKESIKRRGTVGTFGRAFSPYEWHF